MLAHEKRPGIRLKPPGVGFCFDQLGEEAGNAHGVVVGDGAAVTVARGPLHQQARPFAVVAGPVALQIALQLRPAQALRRQAPLALDPMRARGEGVGHGRQRRAIHAHVVIVHAARRGIQPALDRAVAEQVEHQFREDVAHVSQVEVNALGSDLDGAAQVGSEALPQLGGARLGRGRQHLAQRDLEDGRQVDLDDVVQGVFGARQRQPVAAGIRALARELERIAVARKALGRAIHPQELRVAQPVLEHDLDPALEQAGIGVVADAHPDVGGDLQPVRGFQDEVGHRVCHIVTGGVRPAELDVARVAQQQTGDVERRLVVGQDAGGLVSLVVGQEQDVQSPGCAAAVVHPGCHQIPEDPLARLAERRAAAR